jgi:hypothetical protein
MRAFTWMMIMRKVTIYPANPERHASGLFHCWGQCFVEDRDGNGSYSVAIIELEDGRIVEVSPEQVKFLVPTEAKKITLDEAFKVADQILKPREAKP